MKKFTLIIEETVVDEFEVNANNEQEALEIVRDKYKKGEFILSPGEVQYRQMTIKSPMKDEMNWISL